MSHSANEFSAQTTYDLLHFLAKLGFKSALGKHRGIIFVEDLEATLKNVTFDMDKLKLWQVPKK